MNVKYIIFLISGLFLCFLFPSCDDDNSTTYSELSKDAQIYSFSIKGERYKSADSIQRALDSIRFVQINKTKFAIDQVAGIIYNPDSLPFGTILRNKVLPTVTYNPSYGATGVKVIIPDSISGFVWNNTDSLNFAKTPITFTVTSPGGTTKTYDIDIRIHKIDPDTIVWKQMPSYPAQLGASKTLLVNKATKQMFYTYSVQNNAVSLYTTDKASLSWKQQTISGLPAALKPESITQMNDVLYVILNNGDSYKSNNGEDWAKVENGKNIVSLLGILPGANRSEDQLLVAVNDGGKYYFGKTKDMSSVTIVPYISSSPANNEIPSNFPVQKGGAYTNFNTANNSRMLIISGGLDSTGKELNYTWLIKKSAEGLEMTPFVRNIYFKGAGVSTFAYNSFLYALSGNRFYISKTWGDSWNNAPNKQSLDPSVTPRSGQTVIVDDENNIWIFGGLSTNGAYLNDVWKGRLNSLNP